ncbi:uncharacterized protein LOC107876128 isoform X2 [Capsicum annuum]|nr:uncharacterized protein LOC107876128 isoform X2 [Capsicum annuum]
MAQFHFREKFKMVTKPDDYLKLWWDYMGPDERKIVRTHTGHLPLLIEMDAWPEMIHVLMIFWDDQNMVFHFEDVELTPTIEEVLICYESIEMCFKRKEKPNKNILVPAVWDRQTIKEAFLTDDDIWLGKHDGANITFRELYRRFGIFNAFHKFGHKFESEAKWKEMRDFAFAVGLLGTMVFPQGENGTIHPRVVTVAHALFFGVDYDSTKVFHNLAPMIVANIYRALGRCQVKNHFFQGCNLILQWWMMKHLVKDSRTVQPDHKTRVDMLTSHDMWLFLHRFKRKASHEFWFKTFEELRDDDVQ